MLLFLYSKDFIDLKKFKLKIIQQEENFDEFVDVNITTINDDNKQENNNPQVKPESFCVLVLNSQLKLIFCQCHFCGHLK